MFNRAIEYGFLHENPFAKVRMPKTQSRSKRVFTAEEIGAMLDAASDRWMRAFVQFAVTSGLRKSELLKLLWQDIDFEQGTVRVAAKRPGTFVVPGRGEFPILAWTSKSYGERTVPIPEQTLDRLMELQEEGDASAYVFLSLDRLEKIDAERTGNGLGANYELMNNLAKRFQTLQREARTLLAHRGGIGVKEVAWPAGSIHDLRRTYGTSMARVVPIHVLK
jgi:integrase